MKRILYNILFSTIPFIIIVVLAALYLEFIPNHFGKLTLVTIVIVFFVSCKIMPNKYI
ncbi:Uncharacterised protein [Yersinia enterocolitica]|nr:Uncharacterised protein [Yersinia enterocolitica]CNJ13304.1 Uncharacterised protein [Yersinia enterocolitica]CQD45119.1 Uncharacterised protein [Yersinia enterocolitica]CQH63380.1 Uncharacterised protein [Yersinia enterocolitica]CQJ13555.1 Uncharacterised protein [Yersinia enterocolitica]